MLTSTTTTSLVRLASVIALMGLTVALAAPPAAAQPYPPEPQIIITTPGATIIIEGRSWRSGTEVTIIFNNPSGQTFSATAVADETGAIETDVPIPDDTAPGTLAVAFRGTGADGSPREEQWTVQVVSPDAADAPASSNAVLSSDGGDAAGAAASSDNGDSAGTSSTGSAGSAGAADASEQVALGETGIRGANATAPATGGQSLALLLALGVAGAGTVSLLGARRVRAHRAAQ